MSLDLLFKKNILMLDVSGDDKVILPLLGKCPADTLYQWLSAYPETTLFDVEISEAGTGWDKTWTYKITPTEH